MNRLLARIQEDNTSELAGPESSAYAKCPAWFFCLQFPFQSQSTCVDQPFFSCLTCKTSRPWQQNYSHSNTSPSIDSKQGPESFLPKNEGGVGMWTPALQYLLSCSAPLHFCVHISVFHWALPAHECSSPRSLARSHAYRAQNKWPAAYNWTVRKVLHVTPCHKIYEKVHFTFTVFKDPHMVLWL